MGYKLISTTLLYIKVVGINFAFHERFSDWYFYLFTASQLVC